MRLDNSDLELVMRHCDGLGEFLNECARMILKDYSLVATVNRLSDEDILDLINWWKKRTQSQKYTVQILGNRNGYLNACGPTFGFGSSSQTACFQTHFTQEEINKLKQRGFTAIDWDKAIIKPVKEGE